MFKRKSNLLLASAMLTATFSLQAAAPDLPLQQIVDRSIAARGGLGAWRAVNSLSMSGTMDAGSTVPDPSTLVVDPRKAASPRNRLHPEPPKNPADLESQRITLPFQMDLKRPRMMRVELKVKDTTAVQVYDGTRGWKLRPYIGRHEVEPYNPTELAIAAGQQESR
ncbi:MAG: putative signal peptide protein [Gammaproteobacteria bacterium]|nr:putative signal peptide protein [Gammaproteobacteria bacterium]